MSKKIPAIAGLFLCILCLLLLLSSSAAVTNLPTAEIAGTTVSSAEDTLSASTALSTVTTVSTVLSTDSTAPSLESTAPSSAPSSPPTESVTQTTVPTVPPTTQATTPSTTQPTVPETEPALPDWLLPGYTPNSTYLYAYDSASGQLLYSKGDAAARVYPASLTKLFSIYVALQHISVETEVTAGQEVTYINKDSSVANIQPGHRLTVAMLIEGMLLPSGNDATYALAAAVGYVLADSTQITPREAVDRFIEEMNYQAQALGLTGTHFATPDGIHSDDHYTTPTDLLKIIQLAIEIPLVRQYAALKEDTVTFLSGQQRTWKNTNALLNPESAFYCPEAVGLKTGYETTAGFCLASVFPKDDGYMFILVMKARSSNARFTDTLWAYYKYANAA